MNGSKKRNYNEHILVFVWIVSSVAAPTSTRVLETMETNCDLVLVANGDGPAIRECGAAFWFALHEGAWFDGQGPLETASIQSKKELRKRSGTNEWMDAILVSLEKG